MINAKEAQRISARTHDMKDMFDDIEGLVLSAAEGGYRECRYTVPHLDLWKAVVSRLNAEGYNVCYPKSETCKLTIKW